MKALRYIIWLTKEILISGFSVTKIVWTKKTTNLLPAMELVPTKLKKELSRVIYANSITLTPGTISVFLDQNKILVHSLSKDGLKLKPMEQQIERAFE